MECIWLSPRKTRPLRVLQFSLPVGCPYSGRSARRALQWSTCRWQLDYLAAISTPLQLAPMSSVEFSYLLEAHQQLKDVALMSRAFSDAWLVRRPLAPR